MNTHIWANIFGAIGIGLIFITAIFKNKNLVLSVQSFGHIFLGISDIFSGAYAALSQEILCMIRDIGIITKKANLAFKIIILLIIAGVGITVNIIVDKCNIFGFFAVGGNILFTIDIFFNNKNVILFKLISAINSLLWMLLFLDYKVYTTAIANGASAVINAFVALYLLIRYKEGKIDRLGHRKSWDEERKNHKDTEFDLSEKEDIDELLKWWNFS